jgi:metal-responsive CopG/Arc/MetJ family transcriptional regulator
MVSSYRYFFHFLFEIIAMKTLIELSDQLACELDAYCQSQSLSRVAVIRAALKLYLTSQAPKPVQMRNYFGVWSRPGDSLAIEEAYREAW